MKETNLTGVLRNKNSLELYTLLGKLRSSLDHCKFQSEYDEIAEWYDKTLAEYNRRHEEVHRGS